MSNPLSLFLAGALAANAAADTLDFRALHEAIHENPIHERVTRKKLKHLHANVDRFRQRKIATENRIHFATKLAKEMAAKKTSLISDLSKPEPINNEVLVQRTDARAKDIVLARHLEQWCQVPQAAENYLNYINNIEPLKASVAKALLDTYRFERLTIRQGEKISHPQLSEQAKQHARHIVLEACLAGRLENADEFLYNLALRTNENPDEDAYRIFFADLKRFEKTFLRAAFAKYLTTKHSGLS